ncbi:MAG: hypothetical protein JW889_01405 [Verrucomicrobia bacterium]|nr:hypothetical protein [Verrucomicrobiota bacterium]
MDEQAAKEKLQRWFKRLRSGKPDEQEKTQLLIGGALYIILQIIALASLEWKKLGALIPLEVLRVLIEVGLGGTAIFLAIKVGDPAKRGRLVFRFILGRVVYASLLYPVIVFLFYGTDKAAVVMFPVGFTAFSFLVVFLPTIFAAALRIKSYFPELQEGNRVAVLASSIITVIVLPFLALALGLVLVCKLVLPEIEKGVRDLAAAGADTSELETVLAKVQAVTTAGSPLVLGFFMTFVAFIFAMLISWSMRHRGQLRLKLFVARFNFRFAFVCFAIGLAALLFRVTPGGFWKNAWNYIPWFLTMTALAGIQIPALSGWWRTQILGELRGDYSATASSRIRQLMSRCVRNEFVPVPDGLALQRAVTGLDVMEAMPVGDTSAAVAVKGETVTIKYRPSGTERAIELLEPEDLRDDVRLLGPVRDDLAAARRALELRRHGGDLRGRKRSLQDQLPALYLAVGELADEKDVEHEPTAEQRAAVGGIRKELNELAGETKTQDAALADLRRNLEEQRAKHEGTIAKAKEAFDKANAELNAARGKRTEAETTIKRATSAIAQAEQRIAEDKTQLEATGETALSPEAKQQVERRIEELGADIKQHTRDAEKASIQLGELRRDEEKNAAKAGELNEKLEQARGRWGEVRNELEEKRAAAARRKDDLDSRASSARARLTDARREWGRALCETGHDAPALRKAMAPIDENLAEQARLDEELKAAAAERETLRPGVQRFVLLAGILGEGVILLALFIVLLVLAL